MAHNRNPIPSFPIQNGRVVHWNEVESIWRHIMHVELRRDLDHEALPVILMTKPDASKESMESMTKVSPLCILINPFFAFQDPSRPNAHIDQRFVGEQAFNKRGALAIKYPIEHGVVTNWDDWETLCYHVFLEELRMRFDEHAVLLVDSSMPIRYNREKTTQVFKIMVTLSLSSSVSQE